MPVCRRILSAFECRCERKDYLDVTRIFLVKCSPSNLRLNPVSVRYQSQSLQLPQISFRFRISSRGRDRSSGLLGESFDGLIVRDEIAGHEMDSGESDLEWRGLRLLQKRGS